MLRPFDNFLAHTRTGHQ